MAGAWRARRWLGRPTGQLVVAMLPQDQRVVIVAVRTDPLRVVVAAEAVLADGDIRGTRIRLVSAVAAALTDLRRAAELDVGTPLVAVLDACPDPGAVAGRTAAVGEPVPAIVRTERLAFERVATEAGFTPIGVLATYDAQSRRSATPAVRCDARRRGTRRGDLPPGGDLLVTAAVAALRHELRRDQPEVAEVPAAGDWMVEAVAGASW